jgi:hypothetical protein
MYQQQRIQASSYTNQGYHSFAQTHISNLNQVILISSFNEMFNSLILNKIGKSLERLNIPFITLCHPLDKGNLEGLIIQQLSLCILDEKLQKHLIKEPDFIYRVDESFYKRIPTHLNKDLDFISNNIENTIQVGISHLEEAHKFNEQKKDIFKQYIEPQKYEHVFKHENNKINQNNGQLTKAFIGSPVKDTGKIYLKDYFSGSYKIHSIVDRSNCFIHSIMDVVAQKANEYDHLTQLFYDPYFMNTIQMAVLPKESIVYVNENFCHLLDIGTLNMERVNLYSNKKFYESNIPMRSVLNLESSAKIKQTIATNYFKDAKDEMNVFKQMFNEVDYHCIIDDLLENILKY